MTSRATQWKKKRSGRRLTSHWFFQFYFFEIAPPLAFISNKLCYSLELNIIESIIYHYCIQFFISLLLLFLLLYLLYMWSIGFESCEIKSVRGIKTTWSISFCQTCTAQYVLFMRVRFYFTNVLLRTVRDEILRGAHSVMSCPCIAMIDRLTWVELHYIKQK